MGAVHVMIRIGHPLHGGDAVSCQVLADTGATLTMLPATLLAQAGIEPFKEMEFRVADGRKVTRKLGEARIHVNGDAVTARVIFGEPEDASVLGLTVLEEIGLAVDPVNRKLIPAEFVIYILR